MAKTRMARRRKRKWLKNTVLFFFVCALMVGSYMSYSIWSVKGALEQSKVSLQRDNNKSELREKAVSYSDEPFSILVLGVEDYATGKETGRADTQIVMTFNPKKNKVNLVTIPRDTRVQIDHAGQYTGVHKINAAMTYGGLNQYGAEKLQLETTEKLLNIPIDAFVTVNFDGFRDVVNALGGIDIDIKYPFWEDNIYTKQRINFDKGLAHLSGEEALAFVRMRKREVNNLYNRDERQRQLINATIEQAKSAGTLLKVGELTKIFGENVKTSLSVSDLFAIQSQYLKMDTLKMVSKELTGSEQRINGVSYFVANYEDLKVMSTTLRKELELDTEQPFVTSASFN
ncbi:LCP family protein [Kurthia sibirica]|uniref:LytR family transcriptional regulator n=1 Tax=Kurthia sibirica TaxID=202750 RepID=A0A2U3AJ32_9BACL|nr:LCP family protein [Kurthia sibirica]PWI24538.1 LytR family transcriptional regulator [Kurthia sibirica]GEK33607.1 putative transcriptional regulator YvhJ [Kurthia sibirica]